MSVASCSWWTTSRRRHVEDPPAGVARGACRSRSRRSRRRSRGRGSRPPARPRGGPASPPTAPSRPSRVRSPPLSTTAQRCRKSAPASEVARPGSRHAQGCGSPAGSSSCAPAAPARGSARSAPTSASTAPGAQLGVLVEQQAELAARLAQQQRCRAPPCPRGARARISRRRSPRPSAERVPGLDRVGRAVVGGVVDHQHLALERRRDRARGSPPGRRAAARRPLVLTTQ